MTRTDIAYRKTAAEGASGLGLLVALFDTLAGNLRRAADAQRIHDLEQRAREANHAMLVIGYLEDWVKSGPGGDLADQLSSFYSSLRSRLIRAQVEQSVEIFEEQMHVVLKLRQSWQTMDLRVFAEPQLVPPPNFGSGGYSSVTERSNSTWSA